jgi:hypothetical protein
MCRNGHVGKSIIPLVVLFLSVCIFLHARNYSNRIHLSVTLSGHVLFGIGFEHFFSEQHAIHATVFPLMAPGKGFPFALSSGYNYYTPEDRWRGKLGLDMMVIVSPPDPERRKMLPLLNICPGVEYAFDSENSVQSQLWLAFFLKRYTRRFAPIGIDSRYARKL